MTDIYQRDQEESESLISKYLGSDTEESSEDTSRATPEEQAHQIINKNVEAIAESLEVGKWDVIYTSFSLLSDSFEKYHRMLRGEMPRNWLLAMHRVLETFKECKATENTSIEKKSKKHFRSLQAFLEDEKNQAVISYVHKEYALYQEKQLLDSDTSRLLDASAPAVEVKREDGLNVARILSFFRISFEPEADLASSLRHEKAETTKIETSDSTSLLLKQDIIKPATMYVNRHIFASLQTLLLRCDSPIYVLHFYVLYLEHLAAKGNTGYAQDVQACLQLILAFLEQNVEMNLLEQAYDSTAPELNLSTPFGVRLLTAISNLTNLYEVKNVIYYIFLSLFLSYYSTDGKMEASLLQIISNYAKNLLRDGCSSVWRYGDTATTQISSVDSKSGQADPLMLVPTCNHEVKPASQSCELLRADFSNTFPEAFKLFHTYLGGHIFFRSKYLYLLYRAGCNITRNVSGEKSFIALPTITEDATRKAPRAGVSFPFTQKAIDSDQSLSGCGDRYDELMLVRYEQLSYLRLAIACAMDPELSVYTYDLFLSEQEHTLDEVKKLHDARHNEVKLLTLNHRDIDYMILRLHYCIGIKAFASGRMYQAMTHLLLISSFAKNEHPSTTAFMPATQVFEADGTLLWLESDLIEAACLLSTLCSKFALLHNRVHTTAYQHLTPLQKTILQKLLQLIDTGHQVNMAPYEASIALAFKHLSHNNQSAAISAITSCQTWRYLKYYNSSYERSLEDAIKLLSLKFWILNYQAVVSSIHLSELAKMHGLADEKVERSLEGIPNIHIAEGIITFTE